MNQQERYKHVHKADAHSNAFIEELESIYPQDLLPLHLAILMTKCVCGLIHCGIKKEEVLARLGEDLDRYEKRYQDQVSN